jgi:tetratricopeptide (TPR) repeat protein
MRDGLIGASLHDEAEYLMLEAIRIYPDSRQLRYDLADVRGKSKKYAAAVEALNAALAVGTHPDPVVDRQQRILIHQRIAELSEFIDRFDDALVAIRAAVALDLNSVGSRQALGDLYLSHKMLDEAAEEYRQVISRNPGIAAAHYGLAQVSFNQGRFQTAAEQSAQAIRLDPTHQKARYVLAVALTRAGKADEGRTALEEYEQREAFLREAELRQREIAEGERAVSTLVAEGRLEDGIRMLLEAIRQRPTVAALRLKLGLIQSRQGLHHEAIATYREMVNLGLSNFLVHRNLALEYVVVGDKSESLSQRVVYLQRYDAALEAKTNP